MRVVGGTAGLTDALRAKLLRTQVLLGTRVRGLEARLDGTVGVEIERGGQLEILTASSVILALPPRLFGADALTPQAVVLQDWAEEAEIATFAAAPPASAHPAPLSTALPAPWRDRIPPRPPCQRPAGAGPTRARTAVRRWARLIFPKLAQTEGRQCHDVTAWPPR